jgi:hypothetical protein
MNRLFFVTAIVFLFHAHHVSAQHQFQWLIGTWKIKDKPVYEVWKASADGRSLVGKSFKVNGADSVVLETINLTYFAGHYHYIPDVAENSAPVDFTISVFDEKSFVAENSAHDFPKIIRYTIVRKHKHENELLAVIEGNGKVISYAFEKVR